MGAIHLTPCLTLLSHPSHPLWDDLKIRETHLHELFTEEGGDNRAAGAVIVAYRGLSANAALVQSGRCAHTRSTLAKRGPDNRHERPDV